MIQTFRRSVAGRATEYQSVQSARKRSTWVLPSFLDVSRRTGSLSFNSLAAAAVPRPPPDECFPRLAWPVSQLPSNLQSAGARWLAAARDTPLVCVARAQQRRGSNLRPWLPPQADGWEIVWGLPQISLDAADAALSREERDSPLAFASGQASQASDGTFEGITRFRSCSIASRASRFAAFDGVDVNEPRLLGGARRGDNIAEYGGGGPRGSPCLPPAPPRCSRPSPTHLPRCSPARAKSTTEPTLLAARGLALRHELQGLRRGRGRGRTPHRGDRDRALDDLPFHMVRRTRAGRARSAFLKEFEALLQDYGWTRLRSDCYSIDPEIRSAMFIVNHVAVSGTISCASEV